MVLKEKLSDLEVNILEVIQSGIELCPRPFEAAAVRLRERGFEIGEDELISVVESLYAKNYIRRIGPVFDASKLGFKSALAALNIEEARIGEAAALINSLSGVTHNYLREDDSYNMWFTLTAESEELIKEKLEDIKSRLGLGDYLLLPAEKTYKIKVGFKVSDKRGGSGQNA
jgi:DNA-binding Lrp family transcriptional regulator